MRVWILAILVSLTFVGATEDVGQDPAAVVPESPDGELYEDSSSTSQAKARVDGGAKHNYYNPGVESLEKHEASDFPEMPKSAPAMPDPVRPFGECQCPPPHPCFCKHPDFKAFTEQRKNIENKKRLIYKTFEQAQAAQAKIAEDRKMKGLKEDSAQLLRSTIRSPQASDEENKGVLQGLKKQVNNTMAEPSNGNVEDLSHMADTANGDVNEHTIRQPAGTDKDGWVGESPMPPSPPRAEYALATGAPTGSATGSA